MTSGLNQLHEWGTYQREHLSAKEFAIDVGLGAGLGALKIPGLKIPKVTTGRNSYLAISRQIMTKYSSGQISRVKAETALKMIAGMAAEQGYEIALQGGIEGIERRLESDGTK